MRNWDYRFCWLRDATLTLLALMDAGYHDEAQAWREWLLRAVAGSPDQVQIMYGIAGERRLTEWEVPWLPGYEGSAPVRIGNAAHGQLQLDVYGEVMDALHQARCHGIAASESGWALQQALLDHLESVWAQPDEGIWEVRGEPQAFHLFEGHGVGGLRPRDQERRAIRPRRPDRSLARDAPPPSTPTFAGAATIPSSAASSSPMAQSSWTPACCCIPQVGFLPPDDPRVRGTLEAIEKRLLVDGFVLRYDTAASDDGLPPGEGAFLACSFWLVDAYVLQHRWQDARELFERLLELRNDVGLLSEEYDPRTCRLVGNFPQAFTHVALVNSAFNLTRFEKPAEQRARPATEDLSIAADV